jgi:hypothetical protein
MKQFFDILQWVPLIIMGFILFAFAIRIIAKISIRTWFEEKFKIEKENTNAKSNSSRPEGSSPEENEERG